MRHAGRSALLSALCLLSACSNDVRAERASAPSAGHPPENTTGRPRPNTDTGARAGAQDGHQQGDARGGEARSEGEPRGEGDGTGCALQLLATGDLVLNQVATEAVLAEGPSGYTSLLAGYARARRRRPSALAYVNLEHPLVQDRRELHRGWPRLDPDHPASPPVLGTTPPLADALRAAGVDVVSLANNHSYDQDHDGLRRTAAELTRVGVAYAGAGESEAEAFAPAWIARGGCRVAFFSFTENFNRRADDDPPFIAAHLARRSLALSALRAARAHADVMVVAVHWGRDFSTGPRGDLRRLADELVEAGADVVLGTGPHVLHSVERRESTRGAAVVAYSLGNFVSGMGRAYRAGHPPRSVRHPANEVPDALDAVLLEVTVTRVAERIEIAPLHAIPLFTENNWLAHRASGGTVPNLIRVRALADMPSEVRAERRPIIARALGPEVTLR